MVVQSLPSIMSYVYDIILPLWPDSEDTVDEKLDSPLEHFVHVSLFPMWRPKWGNLSIRPNIEVFVDAGES